MELNNLSEKETLQLLLGEFAQKLLLLKDIIPRKAKFPVAPNKIKVAIGMRRSGKTYFLYQHILNLIQSGIPKNKILYINFEDDRLYPLNQNGSSHNRVPHFM